MNMICHFFGIGCSTLSVLSAPPAQGEQCKQAPIVWCEANGKQWGEMGMVCHADPKVREPVWCVCENSTPDHPNYGGSSLSCSIPKGFEHADMGGVWQTEQH